jgi:hypothetical protein
VSVAYRCTFCGVIYDGVFSTTCTSCGADGSLALVGRRPRAAHDAEVELVTARELARCTWQEVPIPAYDDFKICFGALVMITGPRGAGKSTWAARAANSMKSRVLLSSPEEPGGPAIAKRFQRLKIRRESFLIAGRARVDALCQIVADQKIDVLVLDSVQRCVYTGRDIRHILLTRPLKCVLAVSQVNAEGEPKGGTDLPHEADAIVECTEMRWTVIKTRYDDVSRQVGGRVLPEQEVDQTDQEQQGGE